MFRRKIFGIIAICCLALSANSILISATDETGTITLTAKLTIKAGKEKEFETLMKEVVPKVRSEEGNLAYTMCRSKENPRVYLFFEEYADQEAIQAHGKHLGELGIDFSAFLDGPVEAEYYDKIAD